MHDAQCLCFCTCIVAERVQSPGSRQVFEGQHLRGLLVHPLLGNLLRLTLWCLLGPCLMLCVQCNLGWSYTHTLRTCAADVVAAWTVLSICVFVCMCMRQVLLRCVL